jgi:hypothetical protein
VSGRPFGFPVGFFAILAPISKRLMRANEKHTKRLYARRGIYQQKLSQYERKYGVKALVLVNP